MRFKHPTRQCVWNKFQALRLKHWILLYHFRLLCALTALPTLATALQDLLLQWLHYIKQLLDLVFVICRIINVLVRVISQAELVTHRNRKDKKINALFCCHANKSAYCNNLHHRLNMHITELSADCMIVAFICMQLTNHNT